MNSPDVTLDICLVLLRESLSGYQGYPRNEAGERRFAFALQENCVSVGHVREVLKNFDEDFPTVRQIHDIAANLRPRFQPAKHEREEWLRQYGKPVAFDKYPADEMAMHWQAFRDSIFYAEGPGRDDLDELIGRDDRATSKAFWAKALQVNQSVHPDSIDFVRRVTVAHGWAAVMQMKSAPEPMPYTAPSHMQRTRHFATVGAPVTQADIDRASEQRKSTVQVDSELDGWDDPDR